MEQWDKEGLLHFPSDLNGRIRRKSFADELKGRPVQNLWTDIDMIPSQSEERLGYPTQKPLVLLERIIQAPPMREISFWIPSADAGLLSMRPKS
jgi:DNA modification methylase